MKNLFCIAITSTLACASSVLANTPYQHWQPSAIVGYGVTNANQTQLVHLADTPPPGLDNRYVGNGTLYGSALFGIAIEKKIELRFKDLFSRVGLEADYMRNFSVNGTIKPMYNVSPDFSELRYFYDIHTAIIQATGKLVREHLIFNLGGYLQGGLGLAMNRLSNYHEYSPFNSTASPMRFPYENRNTLSPALSAGFGVTYPVLHASELEVGYRFFYTGRGRLAKTPIQETNASIVLSPIRYSFLIASLTL